MTSCTPGDIARLLEERIEPRLEDFVGITAARKYRSLFEVLVAVVLTQNTSDANAFRALRRLEKAAGGLTPKAILSTSVDTIAEAIRPAGMHRVRARRLHELARIVCDLYNCSLDHLCSLGVDDARRLLLSLPGVGEKTADVVLLVYCGMPLFPVDTHIFRISRRLGIADRNDYKLVSSWFRSGLPSDKLLGTHLRLIELGRRYCRPRKPLCDSCPLRVCCRYAEVQEAPIQGVP